MQPQQEQSDMRTREQILADILGNPTYVQVVSGVAEEERKMIEGMIQEDYVNVIFELEALVGKVKNDVGVRTELSKVLKEEGSIFNPDTSKMTLE